MRPDSTISKMHFNVFFRFKQKFLEYVIIGPIWDILLIKDYLN